MFSRLNPLKIITTIFENDLLLPIFLIIVYLVFIFIVRGALPSGDELINAFEKLYMHYGYEIIFVSALLESLVPINLFVPGQAAMVLGIVFARTGLTNIYLVILTVFLGACLGYLIDFILGNYGFASVVNKLGYGQFLNKANSQIKKFGTKSLFLGFIHCNVASFISLAAGTAKLNGLMFMAIAIPATLFWTTFWSVLIYSFGDFFLILVKQYSYLIFTLTVLGLILTRVIKKEN